MNKSGAVQQESRRFLFDKTRNNMEATMKITLELTKNEVGMVCAALDLKASFDEDEEQSAEYRTEFRLLARKFAVALEFMNE